MSAKENKSPEGTSDAAVLPCPGDGPRLVAWAALQHGLEADGGAQEFLNACADRADLSEKDRGLAFEMMQGVWRNRRLLDEVIRRLPGFEERQPEPAVLDLLRLGCAQYFLLDRIPPHALVHETVEVARRRLGKSPAGFVNAALQQMLRSWPEPSEFLATLSRQLPVEARASAPGWLYRLVRRIWPHERSEDILEALNRRLPLYARTSEDPGGLCADLCANGVAAEPRPELATGCVEVQASAGALASSAVFRAGRCIVQDASAQRVAMLVGAQPGMRVVDYCAAPGGKTTALAALVGEAGRVYACDVSARRLERVRENVARLGVCDRVEVMHLAGVEAKTARLRERLGAGADCVLVDAPCSGLGTLRRHPEIRWRVRGADIKRLAELQLEILRRGASLVRPGGFLVYGTCSFAPEENEAVVEAFLGEADFEVEAERADGGVVAQWLDADGWLRHDPEHDPMDSARAVRMRKKG